MQNGTNSLKNGLSINIHLSYDPGIPLLNIYPEKLKFMLTKKKKNANTYRNFIPNAQNLETTHMSLNDTHKTWMNFNDIMLNKKSFSKHYTLGFHFMWHSGKCRGIATENNITKG